MPYLGLYRHHYLRAPLGYLSLQDVVKLADNTQCGFCTACFGGGYPTAVPQDGGKDRFECKISERERT